MEKKLAQIPNFREIVLKQNCIEALEQVIKLMNESIQEKTDKAYKILTDKVVDSLKRMLRQTVGIIKGIQLWQK